MELEKTRIDLEEQVSMKKGSLVPFGTVLQFHDMSQRFFKMEGLQKVSM